MIANVQYHLVLHITFSQLSTTKPETGKIEKLELNWNEFCMIETDTDKKFKTETTNIKLTWLLKIFIETETDLISRTEISLYRRDTKKYSLIRYLGICAREVDNSVVTMENIMYSDEQSYFWWPRVTSKGWAIGAQFWKNPLHSRILFNIHQEGLAWWIFISSWFGHLRFLIYARLWLSQSAGFGVLHLTTVFVFNWD